MPILKILLCMNMLLFVTCSATDSYSFKNKLRGLAAYEKANVERSYVFNANVDLTIDGEIFYHFDSIQSDTVAFYRNLDGSEFYALGIEEGIEESEGVEGKDAEVRSEERRVGKEC